MHFSKFDDVIPPL